VILGRVGFDDFPRVGLGGLHANQQCTLLALFLFELLGERRNLDATSAQFGARNIVEGGHFDIGEGGRALRHLEAEENLLSVFLVIVGPEGLGERVVDMFHLEGDAAVHAARLLEATRQVAPVARPTRILLALRAFNTTTRSGVECLGADGAAQA